MKIHTVFITYNRLELTKQAIASYLATVTLPYTYIVVDNASEDGTREWLGSEGHPTLLLPENRYPGYATNAGWSAAPDDAVLLHRADNDFVFLAGWCDEVEWQFRKRKKLGQLGLRTDEEELRNALNVGGNCVIRRELWDRGLRYDEKPWMEYDPGYSEDALFSPEVRRMKYSWKRVRKPCIVSIASGNWNDPYYAKSFGDRGIERPA